VKPRNTSVLVQVNYRFDMTPEAYQGAVEPYAEVVAAVPGLRWKIWLIDEEKREAAGIYLFEGTAQAQAYLEGPILSPFLDNPAIHDVTVKQSSIVDAPTAITHGPVHELI
jgi:hypothetical protein